MTYFPFYTKREFEEDAKSSVTLFEFEDAIQKLRMQESELLEELKNLRISTKTPQEREMQRNYERVQRLTAELEEAILVYKQSVIVSENTSKIVSDDYTNIAPILTKNLTKVQDEIKQKKLQFEAKRTDLYFYLAAKKRKEICEQKRSQRSNQGV